MFLKVKYRGAPGAVSSQEVRGRHEASQVQARSHGPTPGYLPNTFNPPRLKKAIGELGLGGGNPGARRCRDGKVAGGRTSKTWSKHRKQLKMRRGITEQEEGCGRPDNS